MIQTLTLAAAPMHCKHLFPFPFDRFALTLERGGDA
jgi:hypothetical protein